MNWLKWLYCWRRKYHNYVRFWRPNDGHYLICIRCGSRRPLGD